MITRAPASIELRVEKLAQLFDTLDPLPFRDRDLDRDAEEFIVGWGRELPGSAPIRIVVHFPAAEAGSEHARELARAIGSYFTNRAKAESNELKELFRVGRYSLGIGLVVLALCITASQFVSRAEPLGGLRRFLEESLIILGWVANWRPIEIFLYEWYPLVRRRALFRRLAAAEVKLQPY
jgi:hypothetical protein